MGSFSIWHILILLSLLLIPVGIALVVWFIVRISNKRSPVNQLPPRTPTDDNPP